MLTVFILLLAPFGVLYLFSVVGDRWLATHRVEVCWSMGVMSVFAGTLHFIVSVICQAVMPPYLPFSKERFQR